VSQFSHTASLIFILKVLSDIFYKIVADLSSLFSGDNTEADYNISFSVLLIYPSSMREHNQLLLAF
jgi:hypothetical protein